MYQARNKGSSNITTTESDEDFSDESDVESRPKLPEGVGVASNPNLKKRRDYSRAQLRRITEEIQPADSRFEQFSLPIEMSSRSYESAKADLRGDYHGGASGALSSGAPFYQSRPPAIRRSVESPFEKPLQQYASSLPKLDDHQDDMGDPPPPYRQSEYIHSTSQPLGAVAPRSILQKPSNQQLPHGSGILGDGRSNIQSDQITSMIPKTTSSKATNTDEIIDPNFKYYIPNKEEKKQYENDILKNEQKIEKLKKNRPGKTLIVFFIGIFLSLAIGLLNPYGPEGFSALQSLQEGIGGVKIQEYSLAFGFTTFGMILPLMIGMSLLVKRHYSNSKISRLKMNNKIFNEISSGKVKIEAREESNLKNSQTELIKNAQLSVQTKIEAYKLREKSINIFK